MRLWVAGIWWWPAPFRPEIKSTDTLDVQLRFLQSFFFFLYDRSHTFRFQATAAMAPVARVVVYYVRADGEVVADALNFDVDGTFQNFVRITSNLFFQ